MYKIVFVVLHYENLKDTEECLLSLLKYQESKYVSIVLVDNGSKSQKLEKIQKKYIKNKGVYFLYNKKNLGFSKGNNVGFRFAKYKLKADIIILSNNDLVFKQSDFIKKLVYENRKGFDVAGPRIVSSNNLKDSNPVPTKYKNSNNVRKQIFKFYILYFLSFFNLDEIFRNFIHAKNPPVLVANDMSDFQLHGACLIFSKNYIKKFDGLYDRTFMYEEESILKFLVNREHLDMKYLNDLSVIHKEGSSTKKVHKNKIEHRRFYYKYSIDSCKVLLNLMKGD